jgi:hypothetical protein
MSGFAEQIGRDHERERHAYEELPAVHGTMV